MNTKIYIIILFIAFGLFIGYKYGGDINTRVEDSNSTTNDIIEVDTWPTDVTNTEEIVTTTEEIVPTCVDETEGIPVITSLTPTSGPVGTEITLQGCNFAGFEGDLNVWIENASGTKGIVYSEVGSDAKTMNLKLNGPLCQTDNSYSGMPCEAELELIPGEYKIYTMPWGKKSNEVMFNIQ